MKQLNDEEELRKLVTIEIVHNKIKKKPTDDNIKKTACINECVMLRTKAV